MILYNVLKSIKDNIAHHDTFKRKGFGKFFWQETAFAKKENVFHKYFPMFYDAWHLSEALMEYEIALACTMLVPELGPQGVFWYSIAYYLCIIFCFFPCNVFLCALYSNHRNTEKRFPP